MNWINIEGGNGIYTFVNGDFYLSALGFMFFICICGMVGVTCAYLLVTRVKFGLRKE